MLLSNTFKNVLMPSFYEFSLCFISYRAIVSQKLLSYFMSFWGKFNCNKAFFGSFLFTHHINKTSTFRYTLSIAGNTVMLLCCFIKKIIIYFECKRSPAKSMQSFLLYLLGCKIPQGILMVDHRSFFITANNAVI